MGVRFRTARLRRNYEPLREVTGLRSSHHAARAVQTPGADGCGERVYFEGLHLHQKLNKDRQAGARLPRMNTPPNGRRSYPLHAVGRDAATQTRRRQGLRRSSAEYLRTPTTCARR